MDRRRDSSDSVVNWFTGKRYRCIEIIGKGSYGQVVKSIDRLDNKFVAIKRMELRHDEPINMKRAYREIRILRHLHHPNIVALVDVVSSTIDAGVVKQITKAYGNSTCQQNYNHFKLDSASLSHGIPKNLGDLYLIFEFVDTDLSKIIKSNQYLSTEHVQYILFQILEGLLYLHKSSVLHRDLKPANILVSCADCSIKIADFGLARVVGSDMFIKRSVRTEGVTDDQSTSSPSSINSPPAQMSMRRSTSGNSLDSLCSSELQQHHSGAIPPPPVLKRGLTKHVVTRWYRAPEVILSQPYSAAVDMWSVGCIFAELLGMLEVGNSDCRRRKALFPGDSCGELSAEEDVQLATKDGRRHSHSLLVPETEEEEVKPLRQGSTLTHSTLPDDDTLCSALGSLCGEGAPSAFGSDARPSLNRAGSSANSKVFEELYCYGSNRSQLSVIFEVIGTPGPEADLDFLGPGVAKALRKLKPRTPKDLKVMYPGADQSALDLLRSMLQFNPHLRISVEQALDHPFFTSLKAQDYVQQQLVSSQRSKGPGKVSLPPVLDASIEKLNESGDLLRHSIVQEIAFHRKREELLGTTR